MPGLFTLPVACAALVCGPLDQGVGAGVTAVPDAPVIPAPPVVPEMPTDPTPVKLVEFDGGWEFLKLSRRMRIWRPSVTYQLTVDSVGKATECELEDEFRQNYVNMKLCEVLIEHHTFEPARNGQDDAVSGTYRSTLNYLDLREQN